VTAFGAADTTRSSASAGPSGLRRPCSQLRSVATLTPIMSENSAWDFPNLARIAFTSAGANLNTREGRAAPRTACLYRYFGRQLPCASVSAAAKPESSNVNSSG
jgi:hypothetical protein